MLGRKRIDMRAERVFGQGFQRAAQVDGDLIPGRDLVRDIDMRAVPVGGDVGIRSRDGEKRRGGKPGAGDGVRSRKVQVGKTCVGVQKVWDVGGKRAVGAVDRKDAETTGAGEGEVAVAVLLSEGGVRVHG